MFIDTHTHINFSHFADTTPQEIIARAKAAGIIKIICVGTDSHTSAESVFLAEQFAEVYASVGIHPHSAGQIDDRALHNLKNLAQSKKVVALGETGLDYFKYTGNKETQKDLFKKHIALSQELKKPLIIHDREAHEDVYKIIKEAGLKKGVIHCFSGDSSFAKKIIDQELLISFTGNITFPQAQNLRDVVAAIPLEKMLIETDCPFLAPAPHRGKRNEPVYVVEVAKKIAEIKKIPLEKVSEVTTNTALKFFHI